MLTLILWSFVVEICKLRSEIATDSSFSSKSLNEGTNTSLGFLLILLIVNYFLHHKLRDISYGVACEIG